MSDIDELQVERDLPYNTVEEAIADIRAGKMVVVVDDENRENEGDIVCAAETITPTQVNPIPQQPDQAIQAIRWFMGPIPTALLILSVVFAWFYPITREVHASLREQLAQGSREG